MELFSNIQNDLTEELEKIYHNRLNRSGITFHKGCFGNDTIFMSLYLANDEKELINGYKENDMFSITFEIKVFNNGTYLLQNLSKSYKIRPTINKWLAYERTELSFRRINGTKEKVMASFEKFVDRLIVALKEDIKNDLIHEEFKNLLMEKLED